MTAVRDVLRRLEALGSEQTRKTWRRWGVPEPMFGVLYADLGRLRRELGRDQSLARALWESGNHDARSLAAMLAEPAVFDAAMLERWLAEAKCGAQRMALVSNVAVECPAGLIVLPRWLDDAAEGTRAAGWNLVLHLAKGDTLADAFFAPLVARIEREIHAAPNNVREVMNRTLIAIGARSEGLARIASAAARRIGVVEVDHGDTYCVTPDAGAHIAKIRAQRDARAAAKTTAAKRGAAKKTATKKTAAKKAATKKAAAKKVAARAR